MIDGNGTIAVGAAVAVMVEISKSLMPASQAKRLGPYLVLAFSLIATVVYVVSMPVFPPMRTDTWALFMGWLTTTVTAIGTYHGAKLTLKAASGRG